MNEKREEPITEKQSAFLVELLNEKFASAEERLDFLESYYGATTPDELSKKQASAAIEYLMAGRQRPLGGVKQPSGETVETPAQLGREMAQKSQEKPGRKPAEKPEKDWPYPKPTGEPPAKRYPKTQEGPDLETFQKRGSLYDVAGTKVEDAWLTQQFANQAGISTRVIDYGQDSRHAHAHVRATLPNGQYAEEVVWHDFRLLKETIIWDKVKKLAKYGTKVEYEDGEPQLPDKEKANVVQRWVNARNFAVRDAISKASRRAQLKLLNREWAEEEGEKELERMEERAVQEERGDRG